MSHPPENPVPDRVGTVDGWRVWGVPQEGYWHASPPGEFGVPVLHSVTRGFVWEPRHAAAACCPLHAPDVVPYPGCLCGLYSVKSLPHLAGDYLTDIEMRGWVPVLGQVASWGTIREGPYGQRASRAYPTELHVPEPLMARPLSELYGVPVHVTDVWDMLKAAIPHDQSQEDLTA